MFRVKKTKVKGRGLFAKSKIRRGQLIEKSPVIVLKKADTEAVVNGSIFEHYVFEWGLHSTAIALGFGSLFNHSLRANVEFELNHKKQEIRFLALRDIEPGTELLIDYGYDPKAYFKDWRRSAQG